MSMDSAVREYLDLLGAQREAALAAAEGLSEEQVWRRPAPKEWSIGEILDHCAQVTASMMSMVELGWKAMGWWGRWRKGRAYATEIRDPYRTGRFPMWVGFLWRPRHNAEDPAPLGDVAEALGAVHDKVRAFYEGKEEAALGNVPLYDPLVGRMNAITALRVAIYHDQLHFEDVFALAQEIRR
jgi:hypothetical protein